MELAKQFGELAPGHASIIGLGARLGDSIHGELKSQRVTQLVLTSEDGGDLISVAVLAMQALPDIGFVGFFPASSYRNPLVLDPQAARWDFDAKDTGRVAMQKAGNRYAGSVSSAGDLLLAIETQAKLIADILLDKESGTDIEIFIDHHQMDAETVTGLTFDGRDYFELLLQRASANIKSILDPMLLSSEPPIQAYDLQASVYRSPRIKPHMMSVTEEIFLEDYESIFQKRIPYQRNSAIKGPTAFFQALGRKAPSFR